MFNDRGGAIGGRTDVRFRARDGPFLSHLGTCISLARAGLPDRPRARSLAAPGMQIIAG